MRRPRLPLDGACRCGGVKIRISAPPLLTMACHCTGCQRMSGSAFSLSAAIPSEGFSVIEGEPVIAGASVEAGHHFLPVLHDMDVHPACRVRFLRQYPPDHA